MGGRGSGNWWRWDQRDTTDAYRKLDVRRFNREGLLTPGRTFGWHWRQDGETVGSISIDVHHAHLRLRYRARDGGGGLGRPKL